MTIEDRIKNNKVKVIELKDYKDECVYDDITENYYSSVNSMIDYYNIIKKEIPKYVYACEFYNFSLDIDSILESESDEFDEDILNRLEGYEELKQAIDEFNDKNKNEGSWWYDYSTVVKIK